ncbi:LysR family transcriptional regulator [Striga asiatica]|uniref:LysR family transcriptional regulator n=1 Tax=Striga asiatica TaxID=4170 RepID=A0A5A7R5H5_STRAF|nr:LysR family transcriptional regulator [Striga asiatica]
MGRGLSMADIISKIQNSEKENVVFSSSALAAIFKPYPNSLRSCRRAWTSTTTLTRRIYRSGFYIHFSSEQRPIATRELCMNLQDGSSLDTIIYAVVLVVCHFFLP